MIAAIILIARLLLVCALLAPLAALASEGGARLHSAPLNAHDLASLQNGARIFVNYCLGCHSANYMRYNRLQELGLSEQQIRDNLIFTGVKVGDLMQIAMTKSDAKQWFGTAPPDLTVIARARSSGAGSGADWLYTYLHAFYRDSSRATGWNNLVFENVGMPHVLWQLNDQELTQQEFALEHEAHAALLAAKSVARLDRVVTTADGKESARYLLKTLQSGNAGLPPAEYDRLISDLVNYLSFMAEPVRLQRTQIGIYVLLLLGVLFVFAYFLKREYWKDVQ